MNSTRRHSSRKNRAPVRGRFGRRSPLSVSSLTQAICSSRVVNRFGYVGGGSGGGGGGGTAPVILFTDWRAGPTTGGDGGDGCFLSIYGFNFGSYADWGVTNHVTIGGVEVANYRCLVPMAGGGTSTVGRGVYETWGAMCLTVQVGALGSPTAGVALKIDMTINGTHPLNTQDGSGNYLGYNAAMDGTRPALMFTPQPGTIYFVDRVSGSDLNNGLTSAAPKLTLQGSTGFTGLFLCATAAGATNGMKPGTHVYDMGGTANANGLGGFAVYLFRISGTLETGAANRGPICYSRFPGAVGANSPAVPVITGTAVANAGGGGFNGNDTAKAAGGGETNPYDGLPGWGRSVHISNIKIISAANAERNGAPINLESGWNDGRIVNCDLSWPTFTSNSSGITNAAGISGNGVDVDLLGNWIHDIAGVVADNQNHGIYLDGSVACAKNVRVFMNCVYNCSAGNCMQMFNIQASDVLTNIAVNCNWFEKSHKHIVTVADATRSANITDNICVDAGESLYHISSGEITGTNGVKFCNNTCYGFARVLTSRAAWWNEGGNGSGSTDTRNNIFAQKAGATGTYPFVTTDVGTDNFSTNVFYDFAGNRTTVSATFGTYHDPGFTSPTTSDFSLASGSFCINAGGSPLVTRHHDFLMHAVTGTNDIGALERGAVY